jgi:hypothetical protein
MCLPTKPVEEAQDAPPGQATLKESPAGGVPSESMPVAKPIGIFDIGRECEFSGMHTRTFSRTHPDR